MRFRCAIAALAAVLVIDDVTAVKINVDNEANVLSSTEAQTEDLDVLAT